MPPTDGRRGNRTLKAREPTRFRDGIPRLWQSFRDLSRLAGQWRESGPGRGRTCNDPGKNRELCRFELRSRDVTGRDRTCDAPRFKRALYRTELRSRTWAEPESNRRPPPHQRGALPPELSAYEWARLGSNQRPPLCKRGALPVELHARVQIRDKESNLDLHVQSVVSCRLDDPGTRIAPLRPSPASGDRRSRRRRFCPQASAVVSDDSSGRSRTMFSMPLAYSSTLDQRPSVARSTSYVEELWSPSLALSREKRRLKQTLIASVLFHAKR
jgi:hypothetical protein